MQVAGWLKAFQLATTQMSMTKQSMLSTAHAIFRGLQDKVCDALSALRSGLVQLFAYFRL